MLPQLKRDADGGLTLIIQNESPGKDKEANWLPAPKGPFSMIMRLYWPKEAAMDGKWKATATATGGLEHDPEKCAAVFRKDHAQAKSYSEMTIRRKVILL